MGGRSMNADYRDLALRDAGLDHVLLEERIRSLEADVVSYRELVQIALGELADAKRALEQERRIHGRLRDEFRALREQLLQSEAA